MEDLREFIVEFVEQSESGNITDIIEFLVEKNLFLEESIVKLKEKVEEILKSLKFIRYSEVTKDFYIEDLEKEGFSRSNEFLAYQNLIIGTFTNLKSNLDVESLTRFINERLGNLGSLSCNNYGESHDILDGIFETELVQASFTIKQNGFTLKAMMKPVLINKDPLISYISKKLPNNSIKKERSAYIPLNFGVYLLLDIINQYIQKNFKDTTLKIDFLEYTF